MSDNLPVPASSPDPMTMLQLCIERGFAPEALKQMMDLAERWQRNQAEEAFAIALAGFQADCPLIPRCRKVNRKDGTLLYKFANFEDCWTVARPYLKAGGIGVSFSTPPSTDPNIWNMVVHVTVGSVTKDRAFCGPEMSAKDLEAYAKSKPGGINVEQARMEQQAYRKRGCFCAALGIVVCDEDNDMAAPNMRLDEEQQAAILSALTRNKFPVDRFLAWARKAAGTEAIDDVCDLPQRLYKTALAAIRKEVLAKGGGQ